MRVALFYLVGSVLALPVCSAAYAEGFDVSPIGKPGAYIGCMAVDTNAGLAFVGVGQTLSVMMSAKLLRVKKGEVIDGTWAVDGGKTHPLSTKADSDNTVSADLEVTKNILMLLSDGNQISTTIGATYVDFDLTGSKQALHDLPDCMNKNAKG